MFNKKKKEIWENAKATTKKLISAIVGHALAAAGSELCG